MLFPRLAVVGASGNVGREVIAQILQGQLARPEDLTLIASPASAGRSLSIGENSFVLKGITEECFVGQQLVVFCTESDVSAQWVPVALAAGAYVVDSSSHFRLNDDVPLIIPPVNVESISPAQKLYAHANCLASPISTVLAPLKKAFGIEYVNAVTYQSTAGAGRAAMNECWTQTQAVIAGENVQAKQLPRQIAFNIIPQVGSILSEGMTGEEYKIIHEIKKVIGQEIRISATAVRVPVMVGHSIALTLSLKAPVHLDEVRDVLHNARSVRLSAQDYHTPIEVQGQDDVWVGRLRRDEALENGLQLWLCSDNLRRGAATDAVEILSYLQKKI